MKLKAIALDLDGTLLTSDKKISETNREILKELNRRGVKIFLVTGRTYLATKPYALDLDAGGVVIAYNGAKVVDYESDRVIFELPLEEDHVKELIRISKRLGVPLNLYQNNKWYVEDSSRREVIRYGSERDMIPIEKDFYDFDDYKMTKSVFLGTDEEPETLERVHREVQKILGDKVYTAKSTDILYEVLNREVNKGLVLKRVLKTYGISPEECVAFGDATNDIEMLRAVKYGVAMGNATREVKASVDYVTDTNDNNGVAKFLKKYFFDRD
ncbi:Cof-type HAD-IIB family hydrolase [uncultured Fusobacterium sp.]|uniref:Cof-type HAD-IIB family hydrolase n=1 Tax=uncultured Fusobacterium sp. TaxID=159267 RepID=UPI0025CCDAF0|nr:Cof-type HAD-IIB family hydrolase [uncultured Fusobacterium sp.]